MSEESHAGPDAPAEEAVHVRAFLIADIRGYTSFTRERGDEAAAALASAFARLTRDGVEAFGGAVIELRGDEALAAFSSTRQALRAAVDLQLRYLRLADENADLPLRVGIGVDAGEAVPVEGGFRGSALNMAARLCSAAGPGEILTTEIVTHLAGAMPGMGYEPRKLSNLKGIDEPVRAMLVTSDELEQLRPALPAPVHRPPAARVPFLDDMRGADWQGFGAHVNSMVQAQFDAVNEQLKRELGSELESLRSGHVPRDPGRLARSTRLVPSSAPVIVPGPQLGAESGRSTAWRWLVPALVIAAVIVAVVILYLVLH